MSGQKRESAMRLFEALSGVEQELLERSEARQGRGRLLHFSTHRAGRFLAAAFVFAALGAMLWGAGTVMFRSQNASDISKFAAGSGDRAEEKAMTKNTASEKTAPESALDTINAAQAVKDEPEEDGLTADKQESLNTLETQAATIASAEITEAEARAFETLGDYVPEMVPAGYAFETARADSLEGQETLYVSWTRGMDYITLNIKSMADAETITFTDTGKPETYDVHLYEIPYADTVPEEYREFFENPVFKSAELTPELIGSRIKTYEDSGDTSTPRGDFAVYFEEDNVLIRFNGKGTPKEIMEMFESMNSYSR